MDTKHWVRRGNIMSTEPRPELPGRYLGNGRLGTVIDPFGLNAQPKRQERMPREGRSVITHMCHWGRFRFVSEATHGETAADYLLPALRLYWEQEPECVLGYKQTQDFYDGTVITSFTNTNGVQVETEVWADMKNKDRLCVRIRLSKGTMPVLLNAVTNFIPYPFLYKTPTEQRISAENLGNVWRLTILCPDTVNKPLTQVYLRTNADVQMTSEGLRIWAGAVETKIDLCFREDTGSYASRSSSVNAWHKLWNKSGWMDLPDDRAQQMYVRSLAYLLSSYDDDYGLVQPTSGLSGNMFPFHFVQDMAYIAPALLMTGHMQIVRSWVEKFAARIPDMRRYARHLWSSSGGIYPPWELPFGTMEEYHRPNVPVDYCYEPHNVGYLCRMAAEASDMLDDPRWTARYAAPLIRECADFYRTAADRSEDGHWHLKWEPCIGQDEAGGRNKRNYLCSLYSAAYCFRTAVRFGLDERGRYARILEDGLAFGSLLSARGTLHTTQGADDFGRQKHPVQLDGITYMPIAREADGPERLAYALRLDITDGARKNFFEGWTLGQFLLAGTNLGDIPGWRQDWARLRPADYTDPDWVQLYETSTHTEKSFYMATHGLVLQSLIRNYVNDYWDKLEIAGCPVFGDGVAFGGLYTRQGVRVSGRVHHGICASTVEAIRDTYLRLGDDNVKLSAGNAIELKKPLI